MTRQIRKRAAFVVALNRMPERQTIQSRAAKESRSIAGYTRIDGDGAIKLPGKVVYSLADIAIPITRKRRRAMARAVARRVVGVEL